MLILYSNRSQTILHSCPHFPPIGKIKFVWEWKWKGKDLSSKNSSEWIIRSAGYRYVTMVSKYKTKRTGSFVSSRDSCVYSGTMIVSHHYDCGIFLLLPIPSPFWIPLHCLSLLCPTHVLIFASPSCFPQAFWHFTIFAKLISCLLQSWELRGMVKNLCLRRYIQRKPIC